MCPNVFCLIDYNCILSVTVFVCHDKGNIFRFLVYNKFTSIVYWKQQKINEQDV